MRVPQFPVTPLVVLLPSLAYTHGGGGLMETAVTKTARRAAPTAMEVSPELGTEALALVGADLTTSHQHPHQPLDELNRSKPHLP